MQAQKVRQLLRERGLGSVRVGTVDDYQGQEERIIFISTVSLCCRPEACLGHTTSPKQSQYHGTGRLARSQANPLVDPEPKRLLATAHLQVHPCHPQHDRRGQQ